MSRGRRLRERLSALLRGAAEDRELDEELQYHVERETDRWVRAGLDRASARRRALVAFGGYDRVREETRDARGVAWLENAWRDVRFAARGLRREPGFTLAAVLTLAVGIGATTAVFALANWLLIRPVPGVARPAELVEVRFERDGAPYAVSVPNWEDLRAASPAFAGLVGEAGVPLHVQRGDRAPVALYGTAVLGDYFGVLGVEPARGRFFTAEELDPARHGDVAVISGRLAHQLFGSGDAAIGAVLLVNRSPFTVIGVAGGGFRGARRQGGADVWVPAGAWPAVRHTSGSDLVDRTLGLFYLFGRIAPGATPQQAQAQLEAAASRLRALHPEETGVFEAALPQVHAGLGLLPAVRERTERTLRLVLGIVSILLAIACANVASLLLGRGLARRGELTVRRALGATPGRVAQQQLAEALLVALLGSAAGLGVALLLSGLFSGQLLFGGLDLDGLALDTRVVAFAIGAALLSGVLFAILPVAASVRHAAGGLSDGRRGSISKQNAARGTLTIAQIAASLTLLIGALLLVRTVRSLQAVELGFDANAVYAFSFTTIPQGWDAARTAAVNAALVDHIRGAPGEHRVAHASGIPFASQFRVGAARADSDSPEVLLPAYHVTADFFATLGIPLLRGRTFTENETRPGDDRGPAGVVLSRSAARRLFDDADPVGRMVRQTRGPRTEHPVIGVVEDMHIANLRSAPDAVIYLSMSEWQFPMHAVLVRSTRGPAAVEQLIDAARTRVAPELPLPPVEPLSARVRDSIAEERLLARLLTVFALLAAALAAIGLYGVVAYSVTQRRSEIGIRMALGARTGSVVALVAKQSLTLLAFGAAFGVAGGFAVSRLLASRVFGTALVDPMTYGGAVLAFAIVAALASALPARAAAKVDPVVTLKAE